MRPAAGSVSLRAVTASDSAFLLAVRNEPSVRERSFDSSEIPLERHQSWLSARLARPRPHLYIIERAGTAVGVIRIDGGEEAGVGTVSIALAPSARGQGVGAAALRALREAAVADPSLKGLVAWVQRDNEASRRLFRAAGYSETGAQHAGVPSFRFELRLHPGETGS